MTEYSVGDEISLGGTTEPGGTELAPPYTVKRVEEHDGYKVYVVERTA